MRRRKDEVAAAAAVTGVRLPPRDVIPESEHPGIAPMVEAPEQQGIPLQAGAGIPDRANALLRQTGLQSDEETGDEGRPTQRQRIE